MEKNRTLTREDLRKMARLEDPGEEMWQQDAWGKVKVTEKYQMTLDDLEAALRSILENSLTLDCVDRWTNCVQSWYPAQLGIDKIQARARRFPSCPVFEFPEDESVLILTVLQQLSDMCFSKTLVDIEVEDIRMIVEVLLDYVTAYRRNRDLPRSEWVYSESMNENMVSMADRRDLREWKELHPDRLERYVSLVNDYADAGNRYGLIARFHGRLCGNPAFEKDYAGAWADAEKLLEITGDPRYEAVLGNMCNYGKRPGGQDFDQAIAHYIAGTQMGNWDCAFKLADMYRRGRGRKDIRRAYRMVSSLYKDARRFVERERAGGKSLAQAAFRLGKMTLYGKGTRRNIPLAVEYLLQADFVISHYDMFSGFPYDIFPCDYMSRGLERCLDRVRHLDSSLRKPRSSFRPVQCALDGGHVISWKARQLKNGSWSVTFQRENTEESCFFLADPVKMKCAFTDQVKGKLLPLSGEMPGKGRADRLVMEKTGDEETAVFYYQEEPVLMARGDSFVLTLKEQQL